VQSNEIKKAAHMEKEKNECGTKHDKKGNPCKIILLDCIHVFLHHNVPDKVETSPTSQTNSRPLVTLK
jgi:hypothetical protein